jgi:hypothetical protein
MLQLCSNEVHLYFLKNYKTFRLEEGNGVGLTTPPWKTLVAKSEEAIAG